MLHAAEDSRPVASGTCSIDANALHRHTAIAEVRLIPDARPSRGRGELTPVFCKRGKCEFTLGGIAVCFGFSKGASMSNTTFIESQSSDPFVRELSRRAIRILNDQSLDRRQREAQLVRLTGLGIAAGMVVGKYDCPCIGHQCQLHDFARIHGGLCERAAK